MNPSPRESASETTTPQGELPVLGFDALIERTARTQLVDALRARLGFPREMFEASVRPVIVAFGEFVQLLPASESHHHVEPGGLFMQTMEVVNFALEYRRGQILPKGAPPEAIGVEAHRWTYAVFVAALLREVGKPIADLRVYLRKGPLASDLWSPLAGPMTACGATSYRFEFAAHDSRQYELYRKLPVLLLNRFVPASILAWLSADGALIRELFSCLSGEKAAQEGVLHRLVSRAAAESMRRNLIGASRVPSETGETDAAQPTACRPKATLADDYLEAVDEHVQARTAATNVTASAPMQRPAIAPAGVGTKGSASKASEGAPEAALRFMGWVQKGLATGQLRFNESGALVHFVPEGMLLVSPRAFREFAKVHGEDGRGTAAGEGTVQPGKAIQRQVLRARWHVQAARGINILTYHLVRGGRTIAQLSGVVIEQPERFVNPVPFANPALVRAPAESAP